MIDQQTGEVTLAPIVSPILKACYEKEEEQIYAENLGSSPHGEKWHTSFHASSFPGYDPKACGRKAIYTLMDIPNDKPVNRKGRAIMEAGKAVEEQIVWRFARAGILLTPDPDAEHQLHLETPDAWLTGSPDAIIKLPSGGAHVVEIKSKAHEKILEMISGLRGYDDVHKTQLFAYTATLLSERYKTTTLGSIIEGHSILYASRDDPSTTCEYRFDLPDPEFFQTGVERLTEWKLNFQNDILPERPKEWKWTETPCKYCPFKKFACKPDYKDNVVELSKSNGIEFAKEIRTEYDYESTRKEVLERWSE